MENGAPFSMNGYSIVVYLLKNYDYTTVMNVLDEYPFDDSCRWMNCVWECLEENQIAKDIVYQYKSFLMRAMPEKGIIPTEYMLSKYAKYDYEILKNVIGNNMSIYKITEYIGLLPILIVGIYGLLGTIELFKRKSLLNVF